LKGFVCTAISCRRRAPSVPSDSLHLRRRGGKVPQVQAFGHLRLRATTTAAPHRAQVVAVCSTGQLYDVRPPTCAVRTAAPQDRQVSRL
jgi:hypothetical protein